MKPTTLPWIAGTSALLLVTLAEAARRPSYGGTLRIEIRAEVRSFDAKDPTADPGEFAAKLLLSPAISGPFNIARFEPGKSATLVANEDYPGGRPFLDSIEIQMGRDLKDQALDFSLGKADVTETGDRKGRLVNTLALVFDNDRVAPALREAISLAIDRQTIQKVLLKDQGEPTNALLPEWFSGYAFLFAQPRDVQRARQLAGAAAPLSFFYDRQDATIRRVAERIAVNAMEAGISLRSATVGKADVRLELLHLAPLADLALLLNQPPSPAGTSSHDAERALLEGYRIVPVLHVADAWATSQRVHNWPDLANVWLSTP